MHLERSIERKVTLGRHLDLVLPSRHVGEREPPVGVRFRAAVHRAINHDRRPRQESLIGSTHRARDHHPRGRREDRRRRARQDPEDNGRDINARCVHAGSSVVDRSPCSKSIQPLRLQAAVVAILALLCTSVAFAQTVPRDTPRDGRAIYRDACAACHGPDGKGMPPDQVGTRVSVPDFTDCGFTSAERTKDWAAIIRLGGPARGFSRVMPAFGDALTDNDIQLAIGHIRTFCTVSRWPAGDLDYPRPLATEKAFPDNETVFAFAMPLRDTDTAEFRIIYERRLGSRGQVEAAVPFTTRQIGDHWYRGLGRRVCRLQTAAAREPSNGNAGVRGDDAHAADGQGAGTASAPGSPFSKRRRSPDNALARSSRTRRQVSSFR